MHDTLAYWLNYASVNSARKYILYKKRFLYKMANFIE